MIEADIIDAEAAYSPEHHLAPIGKRILNVAIDGFVLAILNSKYIFITDLFIYIYELFGINIYAHSAWLSPMTAVLIIFLYYFLMEVSMQRTIGKIFTRTKVMNPEGFVPNPFQILKRSLIRLILPEMFSFLWGGNYHDRFSGTVVTEISRF